MPVTAEIILPLPVKSNFTYRVPTAQEERIQTGMRVLVSFGKSKIYTGLVKSIDREADPLEVESLKPVEEILDEHPVLFPPQFNLFEWIAFYYMCTEGEVFKAALPSGMKPESALRVRMSPDLDYDDLELSDKEFALLEALSLQPELDFKSICNIWEILNPMPRLRSMEARKLIEVYQEVEKKYKPKLKTWLRLNENIKGDDALKAAFDSLSRAPAQENLLMRVVSEFYQGRMVPKTEALKELKISGQVVKALVEKAFIEEEEVQVDRVEFLGYAETEKEIILNPEQLSVLANIRDGLSSEPGKPHLLHGITGSGKTHIYIELIRDVLDAGKQVLYLLPEITLTKQIIDRVKGAFGDKVGIYHSRFSDNERVEIWHKVRKREFDVVVGVRSATFLPWSDLGLIVVDEEHDHSFKQNEPSPRYNARDVAVYYAGQFGCPVILGSATPSMESYQNALSGKYLMSEIHNRAVEAQLPELVMIDMRVERKTRPVKGIFSLPMRQAIESTLAKGEQVILFQNRRGYAPYQICTNCGHVPMCINCDISLTYHKGPQHSRCHYCGHTEYLQDKCPECGNFTLKKQGIGTERIEEEVKEHFPNHTVERMDLDTTRGKLKFQHLLNRFERGQVEILVGTQMVSKGLDFENVTLVGVVNADHLLTFPDFRAHERAYQLLTQVSGRAGRSKKKGYVVIQTHMPENIVLQSLEKPYALFFEQEFRHRRQLSYPPLSRLLKIEMRHKDRAFLEVESLRLDAILRPYFKKYLLGPDYALIARVRNQYRMQFLVKIPKGVSSQNLRKTLAAYIDHYYKIAPEKTLRIILDVDPV